MAEQKMSLKQFAISEKTHKRLARYCITRDKLINKTADAILQACLEDYKACDRILENVYSKDNGKDDKNE